MVNDNWLAPIKRIDAFAVHEPQKTKRDREEHAHTQTKTCSEEIMYTVAHN